MNELLRLFEVTGVQAIIPFRRIINIGNRNS